MSFNIYLCSGLKQRLYSRSKPVMRLSLFLLRTSHTVTQASNAHVNNSALVFSAYTGVREPYTAVSIAKFKFEETASRFCAGRRGAHIVKLQLQRILSGATSRMHFTREFEIIPKRSAELAAVFCLADSLYSMYSGNVREQPAGIPPSFLSLAAANEFANLFYSRLMLLAAIRIGISPHNS